MEIALKKFYNLFWNNKICRNIFLLHKENLLEKNTIDIKIADYYLPRIVISNSKKQKKSELKISTRSENRIIELLHKLAISEEKYLSEERLIQYIDKNHGESKNLISKEYGDAGIFGFIIDIWNDSDNEDELVKLFQKYKLVPSEVNNIELLMKYIWEKVLKETTSFLRKEEVSNLFESIDDISDIYNSMIKEGLIKANKQAIDTFFDFENFEDRLNVFETLYEIGILTGGFFKSYIECTNCLPKTYSGFFNCNIPPNKLKFKCPNCGKEVYYMVPYQINRNLYNHIIDPDGVLAQAISYLLNQHKIKYERNVNLENLNEIDFVIKDDNIITGIIEIKMFRTDKGQDAKVKNLKETVSQVKKTKKKLIEKNSDYSKLECIIVTNITDEEIYEIATEKCALDIDEYNILIMSPESFMQSI